MPIGIAANRLWMTKITVSISCRRLTRQVTQEHAPKSAAVLAASIGAAYSPGQCPASQRCHRIRPRRYGKLFMRKRQRISPKGRMLFPAQANGQGKVRRLMQPPSAMGAALLLAAAATLRGDDSGGNRCAVRKNGVLSLIWSRKQLPD